MDGKELLTLEQARESMQPDAVDRTIAAMEAAPATPVAGARALGDATADAITTTLRKDRALIGNLTVALAGLAVAYGPEFDALIAAEEEARQGRRAPLAEHLRKRLVAWRCAHTALRQATLHRAGGAS